VLVGEGVTLVAVSTQSPPLVVVLLVVPFPVTPPSTPAATKRASASLCVSQARLVPALLTRGSAKQDKPEEQGVSSQELPMHCAKAPPTHA